MLSAPTPTMWPRVAVVVALSLAFQNGSSRAAGTSASPESTALASASADYRAVDPKASDQKGSDLKGSGQRADQSKPIEQSAAPSSGETSAPKSEAAIFLDARAGYERAQALYRSREYAQALGELDEGIRSVNPLFLRAADPTMRSAAADLLRRIGSLRLTCTRAIEDEKRQITSATSPGSGSPAKPAEATAPPPPIGSGLPAAQESVHAAPASPQIEAVVNNRVQKWIDYYTGRGRGTFEMWLRRSGLYMEWMKGILENEGLPTDLVHLVFVESGFNPQARSRSHAVGPWQFIRGTAKLFGLKMNSWVDERRDPERATLAAARYLKHLYALFESWPLALASYNAGEGTIIRAISHQRTNDFWKLKLRRETLDYVPKFLACLSIAREPQRYGFDTVERESRMAFDTISLPGPVDLQAVAAACSTDVNTLRSLNPALLRHAAPTTEPGGMVQLRVPTGTGDSLTQALKDGRLSLPKVETPDGPAIVHHRVRRGETMARIARRYGITATDLARANGLSARSRLRPGRLLRVPRDETLVSTASYEPRPSGVYGGVRTVRVRRGETLAVIAERHRTDVRTLRALNGLRPRQQIRAGALLKVPLQNEG